MDSIWLIWIFSGLLTYLPRLSFIALQGRWAPPALLRRALTYVPPAVLSAIVFPEVFLRNGNLALSLDNPRLFAGLAAMLVAWRSRNIFLVIAIGMAVLYLAQALIG